jgi:pyrroline-5-carboxylate reductase
MTIAFIGAGNMGGAIINGLLASEVPPSELIVVDANEGMLGRFQEMGLACTTDNQAACAKADVVVIAVKPQVVEGVVSQMADVLKANNPLLISVVAGVSISAFESWLTPAARIVRVMPNTPALVQAGMSGIFAPDRVTEEDRATTEHLMRSVGLVQWLEAEEDLHLLTAISGSGPGYVFRWMEALIQAAIDQGMGPEQADILVRQTLLGASKLAMESTIEVGQLRTNVTSPQGVTEKGLEQMGGIDGMMGKVVQAATSRSKELGTLFNGS